MLSVKFGEEEKKEHKKSVSSWQHMEWVGAMINNNTKFSMKTRANGRRCLDSHDKSFKYMKFARKTILTWQQQEQPEGEEKFLALLRFFFRCSLRASNKFSYIIQTEQTSLSYAQRLFVFQTIIINRVWCLRFAPVRKFTAHFARTHQQRWSKVIDAGCIAFRPMKLAKKQEWNLNMQFSFRLLL